MARVQQRYVIITAIMLGGMAINALVRGASRRLHANVDDPDLPRDHLKTAFTKSGFKAAFIVVNAITLLAASLWIKEVPFERLLTAPIVVWQVFAALFVFMVGLEFVFSVIDIFGGRLKRKREPKAPKSRLA